MNFETVRIGRFWRVWRAKSTILWWTWRRLVGKKWSNFDTNLPNTCLTGFWDHQPFRKNENLRKMKIRKITKIFVIILLKNQCCHLPEMRKGGNFQNAFFNDSIWFNSINQSIQTDRISILFFYDFLMAFCSSVTSSSIYSMYFYWSRKLISSALPKELTYSFVFIRKI